MTVRDGLVVSCDKIRGGKKLYDKRDADAKRQAGREMERYTKEIRRGG